MIAALLHHAAPLATATDWGSGSAGAPSYFGALVRLGLVLGLVVIGLLMLPKVLPRLLKMPSARKGGKLIELLESQPLDAGKRLYLVRVGDERFLLGAGAEGLRTLAALAPEPSGAPADAPPEETAAPTRRSFPDVLRPRSAAALSH